MFGSASMGDQNVPNEFDTNKTYKRGQDTKANMKVNTFDKEYDFAIQANTTGRQLFDQVVNFLDIKEVWFFGLQFTDTKGIKTWLKLKKKVLSQDVGKKRPINVFFRAKFFPEDVTKELQDIAAQRLFYYQSVELILSSVIYCPPDTAVLLASLTMQANHGDYDPLTLSPGFMTNRMLLPQKVMDQYDLTREQWEDRIVNFYKDHKGLNRAKAMFEYVKVAQDLEMFGINYFDIKNKKGTSLVLGVDALGLYVYEKDNRLTPKLGFPWSEVATISFKDKKFTIHSADDMSPDFQFNVSKVRINKDVLALCMGNHELYVRRRKDDIIKVNPVVGTHFVSNHPVEPLVSQLERDILPSELTSRHSTNDVCPPQTTPTTHVMSNSLPFQRLDSPFLTIPTPPYSSQSPTPSSPRNMEQATCEELTSYYESSMQVVSELEPSFERVVDSPQTPPASPTKELQEHSTIMPKLEKAVNAAAIELAERSSSPMLNTQPCFSDSMAEIPSESPRSVHLPLSNSWLRESHPNGNHVQEADQEMDDSYTEYRANLGVAEISQRLLRQSEEELDKRQPVLEIDKPTYKKLKNLFEDLSAKEIENKNSAEDVLHCKIREEGTDKYKTLRGISRGHTKQRVSIFEAL